MLANYSYIVPLKAAAFAALLFFISRNTLKVM